MFPDSFFEKLEQVPAVVKAGKGIPDCQVVESRHQFFAFFAFLHIGHERERTDGKKRDTGQDVGDQNIEEGSVAVERGVEHVRVFPGQVDNGGLDQQRNGKGNVFGAPADRKGDQRKRGDAVKRHAARDTAAEQEQHGHQETAERTAHDQVTLVIERRSYGDKGNNKAEQGATETGEGRREVQSLVNGEDGGAGCHYGNNHQDRPEHFSFQCILRSPKVL